MSQSSQKLIRTLFGLQAEEQIFQDFAAAYSKGALWQGRLFLTEHNICFYSNILNKKKKLALKFEEIQKIEKKKTLGMIPNQLEIVMQDGGVFKFTSIYNRTRAYKMIIAIWRTKRPDLFYDEDDELQEEGEEEDEEGDLNEYAEDPKSDRAASFQMQMEEEESKEEDKKKNDSITSKQDVLGEKKQADESSIAVMLRNEGKGKTAKTVFDAHFPYSVDTFYKNFLADDAKFGIDKYFINRGKSFSIEGDRNVTLEPWKNTEEEGEVRTIRCIFKVSGVPFKSESRLSKTYMLNRCEDWIVMYGSASTPDLPYSDTFNVEDKWEVKPAQGGCHLNITQWSTFYKSTMFKNKIESRSFTDTKKDYEQWYEEVKKKKLHLNLQAQPKAGLSHQLEEAEDFNLHREEEQNEADVVQKRHPFKLWVRRNCSLITIALLGLVIVHLLKVIWRVYSRLWELEALLD